MRSQNAMDEISSLPPVLVVSATSQDACRRLRSATIACRQAGCGAVAFSSHWGSPEILVDTGDGAATRPGPTSISQTRRSTSLALAARATDLLRTAGLIDCSRPAVSRQSLELADERRQPPLIRVSIPAHYGVELMLLAGAVLRPLHDSHVMFMGLCGAINAALRDRFDSSSLGDLKRYANQLPKHRVTDLHPLFCLIGAWSGVARGVLDRVFAEEAIVIRQTPANSIRAGASVSRPAARKFSNGAPSRLAAEAGLGQKWSSGASERRAATGA